MSESLVLCYGNPPNNSAFIETNNINFKSIKLKNIWLLRNKFLWQNFWLPFQKFGNPSVIIIEHNPRILSLFPLLLYCKLFGIQFILHGHGGSRKRDVSESNNLRDSIHRWLINLSDAYICYTKVIKDRLSKITEAKKLFVARNTLDTEHLFEIREDLEKLGRGRIKRKLGYHQDYYICFIGRLIPEKRVDYFIDVLKIIQKESKVKVGAIVIGDGPQREYLEEYSKDLEVKSIHFVGAISDWEESAKYLYSSDVMVIPGYVGLAVNHGFCFGLPVVTQTVGNDGPYHSPEAEFIRNGKTGYFVKNGDKDAMANNVLDLLDDLQGFREETIRYAEEQLDIKNLVQGVMTAVRFVNTPENN